MNRMTKQSLRPPGPRGGLNTPLAASGAEDSLGRCSVTQTLTRSAVLAVLALALISFPASAQTARCGAADPSMCDPSLPGVQLPDDAALVRVTEFTMYRSGDTWRVDLTLTTDAHPGTVNVYAWRSDLTASPSWNAPSGEPAQKSFVGLDIGGPDPHGLSVQWEAGGTTWHWWSGLHFDGVGTFHFSAGEGDLLPWWIDA